MRIDDHELILKLEEIRKNRGKFRIDINVRSILKYKNKMAIQLVLFAYDEKNTFSDEVLLFERDVNSISARTITNYYNDFYITINSWEMDKDKEDFDKWIQSKINLEAF